MKQYNNALQKLYDRVGFKEDWVVYPIDDRTEMFWKISAQNGEVLYGNKTDVINETGNHYVDEIYTQRFYDKWIYHGEELTMIFVDTHTDGNRFFAFFRNDHELKEKED